MYFEEFCQERNLSKETIKGYKYSVKKYTEYYNMTLDELIDEAIDEENDNVDRRRRSIKTRLLQFRTHLITETTLKYNQIRQTVITSDLIDVVSGYKLLKKKN